MTATTPTFIPRDQWQDPLTPITGPANSKPIVDTVVHWDGDIEKTAAPAMGPYLRGLQTDYLMDPNRGYSLGYNFAVVSDARHAEDGYIYEVRGWDIRNAANKGSDRFQREIGGNWNHVTRSILLVGDYRVGATPAAAEAVRWLIRQSVGEVAPFPHSFGSATACPGDRYRVDIDNGLFTPVVYEDELPAVVTLMTPLRLYDSRRDSLGALEPGEVRDVPRGKVNENAVAVDASVHVLAGPEPGGGFMTSRPWGAGEWDETTQVMYGHGAPASTGTIVVLGPAGFKVGNSRDGADRHVVIEVRGQRFE